MPIIPTALTSFTLAKAASKILVGTKLQPLVSAIASASAQYIMASAIINSSNVCLGPGIATSTGRIQGLSASSMSTLMLTKAASSGLIGKDLKSLFDAISFGVVMSLQTVVIQGSVIGGGPGSGTGKILGLVPTALQTIIMTQAAFRTLVGDKMSKLAGAIAFGICNNILAMGTVTLINVGVAAPPPAGPITIPAAGTGRII